jgi:hypothetical protein
MLVKGMFRVLRAQCWLQHDDTVALHFVALFLQQLLPSVNMGSQHGIANP